MELVLGLSGNLPLAQKILEGGELETIAGVLLSSHPHIAHDSASGLCFAERIEVYRAGN